MENEKTLEEIYPGITAILDEYPEFVGLIGSEVQFTGSVGNSEKQTVDFLENNVSVKAIAEWLRASQERVQYLCKFIDRLYAQPYEPRYTHNFEYSIVAGLCALAYVPFNPDIKAILTKYANGPQFSNERHIYKGAAYLLEFYQ